MKREKRREPSFVGAITKNLFLRSGLISSLFLSFLFVLLSSLYFLTLSVLARPEEEEEVRGEMDFW